MNPGSNLFKSRKIAYNTETGNIECCRSILNLQSVNGSRSKTYRPISTENYSRAGDNHTFKACHLTKARSEINTITFGLSTHDKPLGNLHAY